MDRVEEIGKFLERYNLPRLNEKEMENLNIPITILKLKLSLKYLLTNKSQDEMTSKMNSIKHLEKS